MQQGLEHRKLVEVRLEQAREDGLEVGLGLRHAEL
jgi:hypothetical protein